MNPQIVIIGGGFGGIAVARALNRAPVDVLLIDRQNHHLFQPLLYQVAAAALSPADIAWPIRRILRRQRNVLVYMAEVTGVDTAARRVMMGNRAEPYDYLVISSGASHAYFGHDDWADYAPGLKDILDATGIRRRILEAFERAEMEPDAEARDALLTFVIIGGGPTGVELAGTMIELARKALATDFRRVDATRARVVLVEAGPKLLPSFPARLSAYSERALSKLGVEVRLGSLVTHCGPRGVSIGEETIDTRTVVWAAGVAASAASTWLRTESDKAGRVIVDSRLQVPGLTGVFVIGDTARLAKADGGPLPGVSAVAKQQGKYVGRLIADRIRGKPDKSPFRYRDVGQLATIGRNAAVADLGWIRFKGNLAWWFWGIVHIYFLINARHRLIIAIDWLWSYLTFDRGARLITGKQGSTEDC
jgi:NADH dehydrogenase